MALAAADVVSFSDARVRLTELSDEVVRGSEKVLTRNGAAYVALVDARKLDYYHALEQEHANLVLLDEAAVALQQIADGKRISQDALLHALS